MSGVEKFPVAIGMNGIVCGERLGSGLKASGEFIGEVGERLDFGDKLRSAREENSAEERIVAGHALAFGALKILWIEGREIGRNTEVTSVTKHGAKRSEQRAREAFAKRGSNS